MNCSISKWGNSYAVRIPKDVIDELGLEENTTLDLELQEEQIILKLGKEKQLQKLLEKITPQKEIDWGDARGKEFW